MIESHPIMVALQGILLTGITVVLQDINTFVSILVGLASLVWICLSIHNKFFKADPDE